MLAPTAQPQGSRFFFLFLCLDDLQTAEFLALTLAQDLVDGLDGLLHLGDLHVAQGIGALLGLLDGLGQTDDAGLNYID